MSTSNNRSGVRQGLDGHAFQFIVVALDLTQIDVLHRIMTGRQTEFAARAVDLSAAHAGDHLVLLLDVAAGGFQARCQQLRSVVALHGIDVGIDLVCLGEIQAEVLLMGMTSEETAPTRRRSCVGTQPPRDVRGDEEPGSRPLDGLERADNEVYGLVRQVTGRVTLLMTRDVPLL